MVPQVRLEKLVLKGQVDLEVHQAQEGKQVLLDKVGLLDQEDLLVLLDQLVMLDLKDQEESQGQVDHKALEAN
jgi:hypothetical protein